MPPNLGTGLSAGRLCRRREVNPELTALVPHLPIQVVLFGVAWTFLGRKVCFQNVKLRDRGGFLETFRT